MAIVTGANQGIGKAIAEALGADRASYINGVTVPVDGGAIRCI
jgi:NAD(P)-dependent dehydrogenase (short-subunit alcohol dehydrogenase family)